MAIFFYRCAKICLESLAMVEKLFPCHLTLGVAPMIRRQEKGFSTRVSLVYFPCAVCRFQELLYFRQASLRHSHFIQKLGTQVAHQKDSIDTTNNVRSLLMFRSILDGFLNT